MAGDWIKFEVATPDKPEIYQLADLADIDPDAVVGKLLRIWAWFDQHSEDGYAPSVTKKALDRFVCVTGFCDHVITAGWMVEDDGKIHLSNFERHNGKTAKNRALTAKRMAASRGKFESSDAPSVTSASAREEKRREEVKTPLSAVADEQAEQDEDEDESPDLPRLAPVPHQDVIALYAKHLFALPQPKVWSDKRKKALKARWHSGICSAGGLRIDSLEWWDGYFAFVATCPHLMGRNDRGWTADLEWLVNESNLLKVIEGKYSC